MRRLLKEANIQTIPPLPDTDQAQDLLIPLRDAKLDHRSIPKAHKPANISYGMNAMAYEHDDGANSPRSLHPSGSMNDVKSTSPIQPSVFPPLYGTLSNQTSLKPPRLPPRCSSFLLPPRQSEPRTMPLHPRIPSDPCPSGSSCGDGGTPAFGAGSPMTTAMTMSMPGAQWPFPSRSLPTNAPCHIPQGYQTPLTPSSGVLTTPGDEAVPNWTWMFGSEFGVPGTDGNNGQAGDLDLDWNDVNRGPWGES